MSEMVWLKLAFLSDKKEIKQTEKILRSLNQSIK